MPPALVPELICSDIARSSAFYCAVLRFTLGYRRDEERFVYLEHDGAALMLEPPAHRGRLFPRTDLT